MKAVQIRETFLQFFREKEHLIVPSAPMVLKNDPTLLFTNAGMNPFKDIFLGNATGPSSRIADTQKCLRVSGKHNDLEEVGIDTYHHTMFEMLGNWSFGDYFKKEAIAWAWELLTEKYGIDKGRIYVTYFGGDEEEDLELDSESRDLWAQFTDMNRILPGSKKDNFWEMGDVGPCGPCSEIHVDIRPDVERNKIDGRDLVNMSHPEVIEIWNLVFMQFNRLADGTLKKLDNQHVDTGMGLERLCMVLQGKRSNYETDLFFPYIAYLEKRSGHFYGSDTETSVAMRVISDHIRAVAIAIADGQLPSNTGAGYVIRRILRRALRYGFSFLGLTTPFFHELVGVLSESLGNVFPEIKAQEAFIKQVIREEEAAFLRTLETGLDRLEKLFQELNTEGRNLIPGDKAFELYDTFGFPFDLTALIATEKGFLVDEAGFRACLEEQKMRSRSVGKMSAGDWHEVFPAEEIVFTGYDSAEEGTRIMKYRQVEAKGKTMYQVVLSRTPFYAESGGQVGDTGTLSNVHEVLRVLDTRKENDLIIHLTDRLPQYAETEYTASVDVERRKQIARNHSATHLLHATLRAVLGVHVAQRGSLVSEKYLRFDFSHPGKVTQEQIVEVERRVNLKIMENSVLEEQREVPVEEALKSGAMALFGEKYGDYVRVICFDRLFSVELCGGIHVRSTGEIGQFRILSESAVAAGVRRIEAISGEASLVYSRELESQINQLKQCLNNPKDALKGAQTLLAEKAEMLQTLELLQTREQERVRVALLEGKKRIGEVTVLSGVYSLAANQVRNLAFSLKSEPNTAFVLGYKDGEKVGLAVAFSDDLVQKGFSAKNWVADWSPLIDGGGGGQAMFASAGGKNPAGFPTIMKEIEEKLSR
jgi:alanyl-tRNA synthetase